MSRFFPAECPLCFIGESQMALRVSLVGLAVNMYSVLYISKCLCELADIDLTLPVKNSAESTTTTSSPKPEL